MEFSPGNPNSRSPEFQVGLYVRRAFASTGAKLADVTAKDSRSIKSSVSTQY